MTPDEGKNGLAGRVEAIHENLQDLLAYIKQTRSALGDVKDELPRASHALSSVEEVTERAAHNLLNLVEQTMASDETLSGHLQTIEGASQDPTVREALLGVRQVQSERESIVSEMMSELAFQDLTCQTLEQITRLLAQIEGRIEYMLDPEASPEPVEGARTHAGSMSGLSRLEEVQQGTSRQDLVDQLLGDSDPHTDPGQPRVEVGAPRSSKESPAHLT